MAASTAQLYRLVKKETNDGRDIITRFVGIMKGYHPEYKPHLRMAAAKELIRQIEFDYEEEPGETATASVASTDQTHPDNPANPDSDKVPDTNQSNPENPDSDEITDHHTNHTNHSSDPYRAYAAQHAREAESIYQSIIRRASDSYDLDEAKLKAQDFIAEFDQFMQERDPGYRPIAVPDNLITTSLTQRMDDTSTYPFDPADYYDLDPDYFYYCMCLTCEACDELDYFFEFMRELEEEYDPLYEDPRPRLASAT